MGKDEMYEMFERFGIGSPLGVDFMGASRVGIDQVYYDIVGATCGNATSLHSSPTYTISSLLELKGIL